MKYTVSENSNGVDIDDVKDKKEKLLAAFQECREGRCSCPTEEYKKLDALAIDQSGGDVRLHLKPKSGSKLDKMEKEKLIDAWSIRRRDSMIEMTISSEIEAGHLPQF
ncbi:MAG: hypothetical protein RPT95_03460 [Candidatus Sedimenticola sp. (ex Thyasira tokunagai)]